MIHYEEVERSFPDSLPKELSGFAAMNIQSQGHDAS